MEVSHELRLEALDYYKKNKPKFHKTMKARKTTCKFVEMPFCFRPGVMDSILYDVKKEEFISISFTLAKSGIFTSASFPINVCEADEIEIITVPLELLAQSSN